MSLLKTAPIPTIYYPESDSEPMAETDVHMKLMANLRSSLEHHYQDDPLVYVSANLFIYYVPGDTGKRIAPDVFVVKGVPKGDRGVYKLWEEGQPPSLVIELSSRKTWREDMFTKFPLYAKLGVQEYYIFDPEYDYLPEPLVGWRLKNGQYYPLKLKKGRLPSQVLGLELVDTGETLRLWNPQTEEFLPTTDELQSENKRLREELAKLKQKA